MMRRLGWSFAVSLLAMVAAGFASGAGASVGSAGAFAESVPSGAATLTSCTQSAMQAALNLLGADRHVWRNSATQILHQAAAAVRAHPRLVHRPHQWTPKTAGTTVELITVTDSSKPQESASTALKLVIGS